MKFRFVVFAITALFNSTLSFAGIVTSSANIDFLAIDGQKPNKSHLKPSNSFKINDAQPHQAVVRVSEVVKVGGSDRSLFESDPIIVTFNGTTEDLVISAPHIDSERDATIYNENPIIHIKTLSGKHIPFKQDRLKLEGFLPGFSILDSLSEYNASGAIAAVRTFSIPAANAIPQISKTNIVVQGENIVEQQLQYWFQQADKETQNRFLNWVKKQK